MLYRKGRRIPNGFLIALGLTAIPAISFHNEQEYLLDSKFTWRKKPVRTASRRDRCTLSGGSLTGLIECKPPMRQIPHAFPQVIHEEDHKTSLER